MGFEKASAQLDVEVTVDISFLNAAKGCTKTIEFKRLEDCDRCSGVGYTTNSKTCDCKACKGRGTMTKSVGGILYSTTCVSCGGLGKAHVDQCSSCSGHGLQYKPGQVNINAPAGITEEYRYSIKGAGNVMRKRKGDLFVSFRVI